VKLLTEGLAFAEGPRWHEGRLWISDMHSQEVLAIDLEGQAERICRVPNDPSGLGWTPDGALLVVSMRDRRLLRWVPGAAELEEVADLSELASFHCNDMVVDAHGRAYVGNFGFDLHREKPEFCTANLILVTPDGGTSVAADELAFPNGTVITPDGGTLIVGESFAARLTAFDVAADGSLSNRREWAKLEGAIPDGICLDEEGAIWVASPVSGEALRVREGGEVLQRVPASAEAFACMLGGPDRRRLFVAVAETSQPEECRRKRTGRIEYVDVDVPGAGFP
jgi:sugar lactone lactonase YvrE